MRNPEPVNCSALDAKIKIIVHDLRNTKGLLTLELYDDKPDDFIKRLLGEIMLFNASEDGRQAGGATGRAAPPRRRAGAAKRRQLRRSDRGSNEPL